MGVEEGAAWGKIVEHEEILLLADVSVVSFFFLFLSLEVLLHFFLGGESDTIDSLKTVILGIAKPIAGRILHNLEGLRDSSGNQMRAHAKIDEVAALVGGSLTTLGDFVGDELNLEGVVLEHFEGLFLGEGESLIGEVGLSGHLGGVLDDLIVDRFLNGALAHVGVIVEAFFERRTNAKISPVGVF